MTRHYIDTFRDFPMPTIRDDAYYGAFMSTAREELERERYAFDDSDGRHFESGREVSRYCNPADYDASLYASRAAKWEHCFAWAIRARAACLANRSRA